MKSKELISILEKDLEATVWINNGSIFSKLETIEYGKENNLYSYILLNMEIMQKFEEIDKLTKR